MSILVIYLILGILYEDFIHAIAIISGLPAAGFGALLTLVVFEVELNFYSFIGIILLVGIVKKKGIMMVDFAIEAQRQEGKSPRDAICAACLRLDAPQKGDRKNGDFADDRPGIGGRCTSPPPVGWELRSSARKLFSRHCDAVFNAGSFHVDGSAATQRWQKEAISGFFPSENGVFKLIVQFFNLQSKI